ncbi:MAG: nitrate reductase [Magnetococcales bacterium]|nr:nitrate reductase [Magnetococcales bacterium]
MPDPPWVRTTCPYCGTGCGIRVQSDGQGGILALEGDPDHPSNAGRLCGKGINLAETLPMDQRLLNPSIRGDQVTWEQALDHVANSLTEVMHRYGPDAIGFHLSGQLLTEDYYVANKLAKGFIGTANVDSNSRLCMASAVAGHQRAFGADLVPGCYEDLEEAELVILVGSNAAWCHPVLFGRLLAARQRHPERMLVVIDPRHTHSAQAANMHLPIRSGSDAWLWLGLMQHLFYHYRKEWSAFPTQIDWHTQDLAAAYGHDISAVAAATGLQSDDITRFYNLFLHTERTVTLFSQGINQSEHGSDTVNAIINCHLLTGRIGRPGMGPFSLTGQPNAMGGREVGALANQLAAHMQLDNPTHRQIVAHFWGSKRLASQPGLKAVQLFQAAEEGKIKALWIMGTNPLVSLPDGNRVRRALERCPLVIVSDSVVNTDTAAYAHVLLPARPWGEKSGTVTNSERRISRQKAFLPPLGQSMPDWWMLAEVGRRMGFANAFAYPDEASIFKEHATLSGLGNDGTRPFDIAALADQPYDSLEPIQWPVQKLRDGGIAGTRRLGGDGRFFTPKGKARILEIMPATTRTLKNGELRLNTGRIRDQWHTMTRTGVSPALSRHEPQPLLDIHPEDAARHTLQEGELVRLVNAQGEALLRVRMSAGQRRGELFAPMHWSRFFCAKGAINALVAAHLDPISGQPAFKSTAVRLEPVIRHWRGFLLSRTPLDPTEIWWCRRAVAPALWQYDLEGLTPLADWRAASARWLAAPEDAEWIECTDAAQGRFRRAWRHNEQLMGCLFIEHTAPLPDSTRLLSFFAHNQPQDLLALLAGAACATDRRSQHQGGDPRGKMGDNRKQRPGSSYGPQRAL